VKTVAWEPDLARNGTAGGLLDCSVATRRGYFKGFAAADVNRANPAILTGHYIRDICSLQPSIELAARLDCGLVVALFVVATTYGAASERALSTDLRQARSTPGRLMCSYFTHFADTKAEEEAARARQSVTTRNAPPRHSPAIPKQRRRAIAFSSVWSSGCVMCSRRI